MDFSFSALKESSEAYFLASSANFSLSDLVVSVGGSRAVAFTCWECRL